MATAPNTITFPKGPLPKSYFTENRGHILIAVASSFIVLEIAAFGLRIISRRLIRVPFGWDDVFCILALVFNLFVCAAAIAAVPFSGTGRHTLPVLQEDFAKIAFMGKNSLLIMPLAYVLAIACSKGVILHLYLRLFRAGPARKVTIGTAVVVISYTTALVLVTIFQCKPISSLWTDVVRNNCIDTQAFFEYASIPNFLTDLAMLILPLPEIWRLSTTFRMKVGLTVTILTGSVGIISTLLRFIGFRDARIFADPCWESVNLMSYTVAETGTCFLAACLPTFRPLLRAISNTFSSSFSKMYTARRRASSDSALVEHAAQAEKGDTESPKKSAQKEVKGFTSVLLSNISVERPTISDQV